MPQRLLTDRLSEPLRRSITLRPALADDDSFLYRVYASTRADQLRVALWDDAQTAAFLLMQFTAQSRDYHERFPDSGYEVIVSNGEPVGRLFVHRSAAEIRVVDLGLLPEQRNRGIGSALLLAVLEEAGEAGKPVRLHVERFNRALRLYERLGFESIGSTAVHIEMQWMPRAPRDRAGHAGSPPFESTRPRDCSGSNCGVD